MRWAVPQPAIQNLWSCGLALVMDREGLAFCRQAGRSILSMGGVILRLGSGSEIPSLGFHVGRGHGVGGEPVSTMPLHVSR